MSTKHPRKAPVAKCGYVDFECTSSAKFDEMHRNKNRAACLNGYERMTTPTACVLIPFPTAKAAKAFCKVANMTERAQAAIAMNAFYSDPGEQFVKMMAALESLHLPNNGK